MSRACEPLITAADVTRCCAYFGGLTPDAQQWAIDWATAFVRDRAYEEVGLCTLTETFVWPGCNTCPEVCVCDPCLKLPLRRPVDHVFSVVHETTNRVTVVYNVGKPLSVLGIAAVATLACEYAKKCAGAPCLLPEGVTEYVTGNGTRVTVQDPAKGITGIISVDRWLAPLCLVPSGFLDGETWRRNAVCL